MNRFIILLLLIELPTLIFGQESPPEITVIELAGKKAFLDIGKTGEITRGDEYVLRNAPAESSGKNLLIVEEVKDQISIATVIYSDEGLAIGTTLEAIRKTGLDSSLEAQALFGPEGIVGVLDFRESINRRFFRYRPYIGTQVMFIPNPQNEENPLNLLVNATVGGEINWYLWRILVAPALAGGIAMSIPLGEDEAAHISHAGGYVELGVKYIISPRWKVGLSVGFASWIALPEVPDDTYSGITMGAGATVRY